MPKTTTTGPKQADRSLAATGSGTGALNCSGASPSPSCCSPSSTRCYWWVWCWRVATVAAAWLGFRELVQRADRDDAESAAAYSPAPGVADRREPEQTSADTPWHGHHAA